MHGTLRSGIANGAARAATYAILCLGLAAGSNGGVLNNSTLDGDSALDGKRTTFLLNGRPVDEWQPPLKKNLFDNYKQALNSITDAKSCLLDDNLPESKINWDKINSLEHLNVCIFFTAAQLRSVSLAKNWLLRNNFIVSKSNILSASIMRKMGVDGEGEEFSAALANAEFPKSLNAITSVLRPKNLGVTITFDEHSRPLNVNSGFNYK